MKSIILIDLLKCLQAELNPISKQQQNTIECWLRISADQWGAHFLEEARLMEAVQWGEVIRFLFCTEMAAEQ